MSLFTTRVELQAANEFDYDNLHYEMAKEGFWNTIPVKGEKKLFKLPTAEYNKSGEFTPDILAAAKRAATKTGRKFSILVTKVDGMREWYNLAEETI